MNRLERQITVCNQLGLHARAAAKLVKLSAKFAAHIELVHGEAHADAKSILSLLTLSASCGSVLDLTVTGEDAEAAAEAVCALFADRFGEDE